MECGRCGAENPDQARFCDACGMPLDPEERRLIAAETGAYRDLPAGAVAYGGFWRRAVALVVDQVIVMLPLAMLQQWLAPGTMQSGFEGSSGGMAAQYQQAVNWWLAVELAVAWLYWAGLHSSPWQATPGKALLGMRVTNREGQRITFVQATIRYLATLLSSALLLMGFVMAAFHPRKRALHDILAGTLVVRSGTNP